MVSADILGLIGAIMPATFNREFQARAFRCATLDGYGIGERLCRCRAAAAAPAAFGSCITNRNRASAKLTMVQYFCPVSDGG
jgi:hypothetical protein